METSYCHSKKPVNQCYFLFVSDNIRSNVLPSLRTYLKEVSFLTAPARNRHPQASHRQDADEHEPADLGARRPLPGERRAGGRAGGRAASGWKIGCSFAQHQIR